MSRSGWALACAVAAGVAALVVGKSAAALDGITVGIAGRAGAECGGYCEALAYASTRGGTISR